MFAALTARASERLGTPLKPVPYTEWLAALERPPSSDVQLQVAAGVTAFRGYLESPPTFHSDGFWQNLKAASKSPAGRQEGSFLHTVATTRKSGQPMQRVVPDFRDKDRLTKLIDHVVTAASAGLASE